MEAQNPLPATTPKKRASLTAGLNSLSRNIKKAIQQELFAI